MTIRIYLHMYIIVLPIYNCLQALEVLNRLPETSSRTVKQSRNINVTLDTDSDEDLNSSLTKTRGRGRGRGSRGRGSRGRGKSNERNTLTTMLVCAIVYKYLSLRFVHVSLNV